MSDKPLEDEAAGDFDRRDSRNKQSPSHGSLHSVSAESPSKRSRQRYRFLPDGFPWVQRSEPPAVPSERAPSREYGAKLFSRITFQWVAPLLSLGYKRRLELNDIWAVNPDREVDRMKHRLLEALHAHHKAGKNRPLLRAILDTYRAEYLLAGACQLATACLQVLSPYTLKYLINFVGDSYNAHQEGTGNVNVGHGIGLVVGITAMQYLQFITANHFIYHGMIVGGQCRSTLVAVIFDKALRLSGRARAGNISEPLPQASPGVADPSSLHQEKEKMWYVRQLQRLQSKKKWVSEDGTGWSNGRIVNLMSTDTFRIEMALGMFHLLWTAPIQALLCLGLLLSNLGVSALAGFAFLCIIVPLLSRMVKSLTKRRQAVNKITDERVTLSQELVGNIRFVKLFAWELSYFDRLTSIRDKEVGQIAFILGIRSGMLSMATAIPVVASMLSFIVYNLTSHQLAPGPIFSSLSLFQSLRVPLTILTMVMGQVVDGVASVTRLEQFLLAEDITDDIDWKNDSSDAVTMDAASFTWESNGCAKDSSPETDASCNNDLSEKPGQGSGEILPGNHDEAPGKTFTLENISLNVGRNEFLAVIGSIGSGKSSFLSALAGDMRKTTGSVALGCSRAFCSQDAWLQDTSVQQNIIFGKELRPEWYEQVVDACALQPDLDILPHGDQTEVGERGITVSGGQKQRINMARAIYAQADLVLMDDPLSAVDAHVGQHLMDKAICGLLKDRCRILATHQLHVLHRVDRILWLKQGRIHRLGTFDELMHHEPDFRRLLVDSTNDHTASTLDTETKSEPVADDDRPVQAHSSSRKQEVGPAEEKADGSVGWAVYLAYLKSSGAAWVVPSVVILLLLVLATNIGSSLWLSWWTGGVLQYSDSVHIAVYICLGIGQALSTFGFGVAITVLGTRASKNMFNRALFRVLRSPVSFFDMTPTGRIMNRFARDVDVMDNILPEALRLFLLNMGTIVAGVGIVIAYYYYLAVALVPLLVVFYYAATYYRASAREVKRYESVLRSFVYSRFCEAIVGISTIRAYLMQRTFERSLAQTIDSMDGAYFLTYANQRWLASRMAEIGTLLLFIVGILIVTSSIKLSPSIAGLALSYILSTVQVLSFVVKELADVENNMNSAERLHHYGQIPEQEAALHGSPPPPDWPSRGEVSLRDVQMRYRPNLPLVLKGLSLDIKAGEKIGIVGRTGAGKSSIISALFRLTELSGGTICIDGVDISRLGLHDLRSRLALIPQNPTLMYGTVRRNLDPLSEHSDQVLWDAFGKSGLRGSGQDASPSAKSSSIELDTIVEHDGSNFSLGQRQLLTLARALVRDSQILICDEATSSVDSETDERVQKIILESFAGRTLMCIAHRLRTIIHYDRILVLDSGMIAEFDTPQKLYDMPESIFRKMCDTSGISGEDISNKSHR